MPLHGRKGLPRASHLIAGQPIESNTSSSVAVVDLSSSRIVRMACRAARRAAIDAAE